MLSLNIKLALLSFAVLPFLFVGIMIIKKFQRKAWQLNSAKNSNLTAYMHESIAGMKITQSFVREKKNFGIFEKLSYEVKDSWMGAVRWQFMTPILIDILAFVATGLIYFSSLYFNFGITIETGVLIAFISYNERFWQPIAGLGNFYNSIITAMAYLERIFETLDERPTVVDIPDAAIMPTIKGDVEFRNVFFGYEPGNLILEDLNFKISAGETIALVGPTGAGKTTIVNLLSRFYNINSGQILIDGVDIGMVTLSSLRKQMGVMMQDTFIFSGTIADNIRYSKLDATDEEVIAAAKVVRAHDFIVDMEHGYDTQVSEKGSRLSSGQRQLLSFARALLANPKILILDEATSSIDTETELRLQEGLNRLLEGRTSFVIAHRLSTIKNATRIMVIDNKNILEQGSHDELISLGGAYHNLYTAQLDSD
jgi:ATP-binding cassette subfamily B protein